jgi:hypothetical protein
MHDGNSHEEGALQDVTYRRGATGRSTYARGYPPFVDLIFLASLSSPSHPSSSGIFDSTHSFLLFRDCLSTLTGTMRFAALSIVALASVAIAGPVQKRQDASDLDALLDAYDAVPDVPDLAPPMGAITSTATVTYDATAVVAAATSAAATGLTKRDTLEQRDVDPAGCVIDHASGLYKGTVSPDTPDQFSADMGMQNLALNAATPPGYFLVNGYKNLKASASAPGYKTMWQDNIASYDPAFCAAGCNKMAGCNTFVICTSPFSLLFFSALSQLLNPY